MWRAALYHALLTLLIGGIAALTVWAGTAAPEVPVTPPAGAAAQEAEITRETVETAAVRPDAEEETESVIRVASPKTGDNIFAFWEVKTDGR